MGLAMTIESSKLNLPNVLLVSALGFGLVGCGGGGGDDSGDPNDPNAGANQGIELDTQAPDITLLGKKTYTIALNSSFTDEGATASDDVDGDLTADISVSGSVNTSAIGSYSLVYTVVDAAGNSAEETRIVEVVADSEAPEITLTGDAEVRVALRTSYSDAGASAFDNIDGDLTGAIAVNSDVDIQNVGSYTVTFSVSDSSGNVASVERQVEVFNELPQSVNQAAYQGGVTYQYGHNSIPNIMITGAPLDTDRSRMAMLHDGERFRMYFFKVGSNDTFYQFAYNPSSGTYEYGFDSIPVLKVVNMPVDADPSSFAMLHDGTTYRFYMQSKTTKRIYQAAFNTGTQRYEYGYNSINFLNLTKAPADTDFDRWAMLHDGSAYRFYAFKSGSDTQFYQFAYNAGQGTYEYAYNNAIPTLTVAGMPANSDRSEMVMLHDGSNFRFYFQKQ